MSIFDPNTFKSMSFDGANDTKLVTVPAGEYTALVDNVDIVEWKKRDNSGGGLKLSLQWEIMDEAVKEITGRAKNTVKQDIMLDLTESGGLDFGKGKNVRLGRLRTALGCNTPGAPFSFDMMTGRQGKVLVKHRPDSRDPEVLYAEVDQVAAV